MNLCYIIGKINTDIEFDFIYKSKYISIVRFEVKTKENEKIMIKAYNEIADYCYSNLKKDKYILLEGRLCTDSFIEIIHCIYI